MVGEDHVLPACITQSVMNDTKHNAGRQERIDTYVRQRMNADEAKAFEAEMESDVALRRQHAFTRSVKNAVTQRAELEARMAAWDAEEHPTGIRGWYATVRRAMLRRPQRTLWMVGIAAAMLIAVWLFPTLFSTTLSPENGILDEETTRGASDLSQVETMIVGGECRHALQTISNEERIAHIELQRMAYEEASASEEECEEKAYEREELELRMQDLQWLKVYALYGAGDCNAALRLAQEISRRKGIYSSKADSILRMLKRKK